MNIQPPSSSRPREISVVEPVSPALERVKQMLFKPFDLAKWITIGFCAWLAGLGESGGGGGFNYGNHYDNNSGSRRNSSGIFTMQASDFVMANLGWIIPLTILVRVARRGAVAAGVMVEQPGEVHVPALRGAGQSRGGGAME